MRFHTSILAIYCFSSSICTAHEEVIPPWISEAREIYWITSKPSDPDIHYIIKITEGATINKIGEIFKHGKHSRDYSRTTLERGDQLAGWLVFKNEKKIWAVNIAPSMDRHCALLTDVKKFSETEFTVKDKNLVDVIKVDENLRTFLGKIAIPQDAQKITAQDR